MIDCKDINCEHVIYCFENRDNKYFIPPCKDGIIKKKCEKPKSKINFDELFYYYLWYWTMYKQLFLTKGQLKELLKLLEKQGELPESLDDIRLQILEELG